VGRFGQRDQIDVPGESRYAYCGGEPMVHVDPSGKQVTLRVFKRFCVWRKTEKVRSVILSQLGVELIGAYENGGRARCGFKRTIRVRNYYRTMYWCVYTVWTMDVPSCRRQTSIITGPEYRNYDRVVSDVAVFWTERDFQYRGQSAWEACGGSRP